MKTDIPILKRLGPIPFWRGEKKCLSELNRIYHRAMEAAVEARENVPVDLRRGM